MHIELCKEEIESLSPSEKHVVLNSLQDVKKNSDPVEITYGELNDLMSLHVANIYLALTSEAFRNGEFAKCEAEACKNYLKHEVPGILKEMQKQQEAENNDTDSTAN